MRGYTRIERAVLTAREGEHFDWRELQPVIERGLYVAQQHYERSPLLGLHGVIHVTALGTIARRLVLSGLVALAAGCASTPAPIAPTKHAACSTAAAPELTSCPYLEELPKTRLYTSSGLECEHCNVAEFSR